MSEFIKITEENQELYHFGVKGMRWGHRSGNRVDVAANKISKYSKAIDKDIASFKPYANTGIKDKKGRQMLSPRDY